MSVAALRRVKIRDPASLDVIAQSLSDLRAGDNTTLAEALVYLCEVLGRSGNGRYRNVLEDIAATAGAARVRLQAVDESRRLPAGDKAPFVPVTAAAGAKAG